ncbi:beta strand repeat-containing protein [Pseudoduganella lutea]|uniref:Calcium-binding protein n=1 Tax=Pseudoduganella lutea TaxID=321985 RepID=A0A4P6KX52_9BURK|nr:calcium-binding protein [Pseudoduganella lutea]QBE63355.1 calcium-binding protein [Pseudoduganella lutea]
MTARGDAGDDLFDIVNSIEGDIIAISGGAGRDTVHFERVGRGIATITGFATGAGGDWIDLSAVVEHMLYQGYSGGNPFAPGGPFRLSQSGADTVIDVMQDNGIFWRMIVLKNVRATALTGDNFVGGYLPDGSVMPGLVLAGDGNGNYLGGGINDDSITGLGGGDVLDGSGGSDTLDGGGDNDSLSGGGGNDLLLGGSDGDDLRGGAGNDSLLGGSGADKLEDGTGADSIDGEGGNDVITVTLDGVTDTVLGGDGNDTITILAVSDSRTAGAMIVDGGAGADVFVLASAGGTLALRGGEGRDTYQLGSDSRNTMIAIADFATGPGGDVFDVSDLLRKYSEAYDYPGGNPFDPAHPFVRLVQSNADTLLQARQGSGAEAPWYTLARLENTLATALTADNFKQGLHPDGSAVAGIAFAGDDGKDWHEGTMFNDTLNGNGGNDTMMGGPGGDVLDGGAGDDLLSGNAGDDTLAGGAGNDTLSGDNSRLDGGDGADSLSTVLSPGSRHQLAGGAGDDLLKIRSYRASTGSMVEADGGAGADVFVLETDNAASIVLTGGGGADRFMWPPTGFDGTFVITDFGADDVIDIEMMVLGAYAYYGQGGNPFATEGGMLRVMQQGSDTLVQHRAVGSEFRTVFTLRDTDATSLTAANFSGYSPDGAGVPGEVLSGTGMLKGTLRDDTITSGAGNDSVFGSGGNDLVHGGGAVDTLEGGYGNDTLHGDEGNDWLMGDAGNDVLHGGVGNDTLGGGHDMLNGQDGDDLLDGGDGNDSIRSSAGTGTDTDTLRGGAGDDFLVASTNAVLEGGDGNDTLSTHDDYSSRPSPGITMTGGAGSDLFILENMVWWKGVTALTITDFEAGPGGDRLDFSGLLWSSAHWTDPFSHDFRWVQDGSDALLQRSDGLDTYITRIILRNTDATQVGQDNYVGITRQGSGMLDGTPGRDSLTGSDNFDHLDGGLGVDTLVGGSGSDQYTDMNAEDVIVELADGGFDTVITGVTYTLPDEIERGVLDGAGTLTGNAKDNFLTALTGAATLAGAGGDDGLAGSAGDDLLQGGDGNDTLEGNAGDDMLEAGTGHDSVVGGGGNDTLVLLGALADYSVRGTSLGVHLVNAATNEDIIADNIDWLRFTDGARRVTELVPGTESGDDITGTDGNDTLDGQGGADTMHGGAGDDTYIVDNEGDVVEEDWSDLADTVQIAFTKAGSYVLAQGVENAVVTAPDNIAVAIIGNGLDNGLTGNGAANHLAGGTGWDTLDGGAGNDTMVGGDGYDVYFVDSQGDVVIDTDDGMVIVENLASYTLGANLHDLRYWGTGAFTGKGNALDNTLQGGSGDDKLDGAAGNDRLYSSLGNDTLQGGVGNDTMTVRKSTGNMLFDGGTGTDVVEYAWNLAEVRITRPAENDVLVTHIATGATILARNAESFRFADTTLSLAAIRAAAAGPGADALKGTEAGDYLDGMGGNDQLWGFGGNDTLDGGTGSDKLAGGMGNDTYVVDATGDKITELAGQGTDTVSTKLAKYTLGAHLENLTYTGTTAFAGTGNAFDNVIAAGFGNDTIDGAAGKDRYVIDGDFADFQRQSPNDKDLVLVKGTQKITLRNIEEVEFSDGVKTLAQLQVNVASQGNDTLTGTDGDDQINGLAGADQLTGGKGDDAYFLDNVGDTVIELANGGIDTVNIGIAAKLTYTLGANIEHATITSTAVIHLVGNAEDNTLTGNAAANMLTGGAGNDTLVGGKGNDTLDGGAGDDVYSVDAAGDKVLEAADGGYDIVETTATKYTLAANVEELRFTGKAAFTGMGNALDNVILGGTGNDKLTGGLGADTFVIGAGNDTITDFVSGTDHLAVAGKIGNGNLVIDDAAIRDATGGFSSDAELVIFTQNVSSLTTTNAAKAIGNAREAYAKGDTALFALHSGNTTAVYLFTSSDNDAVVSKGELQQIATLTGVQLVSVDDFH